jgi:Tfp pilus assembly protein PilX
MKLERGSTLIIAVVLTFVFTTVVVAVTNFSLSDIKLAQGAKESSYAFYAADTGLECALYYDLGQNEFFDNINSCSGSPQSCEFPVDCGEGEIDAYRATVSECPLPSGYDGCYMFTTNVDVGSNGRTYQSKVQYMYDLSGAVIIRSRGYNSNVSDSRRVERALEYTYTF